MGGGGVKEVEKENKIGSIFKKEAIFMMVCIVGITLLGLLLALVGPRLWRFLSH